MVMKKQTIFILAILLAATIIAVFVYFKNSDTNILKVNNAPRENKQIEEQAFQHKDSSECEKIKGASYEFGPTDEQMPISESSARQLCKDNIKNNVTPVLHGG